MKILYIWIPTIQLRNGGMSFYSVIIKQNKLFDPEYYVENRPKIFWIGQICDNRVLYVFRKIYYRWNVHYSRKTNDTVPHVNRKRLIVVSLSFRHVLHMSDGTNLWVDKEKKNLMHIFGDTSRKL